MSPKRRKAAAGDVATNRRARHKYELLERFECGIELVGSEVKSLREGKAQIGDAYAVIMDGEVWLRNAHIPPYAPASIENHDPERPRKLLLHRYEIERLVGRLQRKGLTLIPTRIYFKGPRAKVELALARGKEQRDRRREIRDRDVERDRVREVERVQREAEERVRRAREQAEVRVRQATDAATRAEEERKRAESTPDAGALVEELRVTEER